MGLIEEKNKLEERVNELTDELKEQYDKAESFWAKNRRYFIIGIGVLSFIAGVIVGY